MRSSSLGHGATLVAVDASRARRLLAPNLRAKMRGLSPYLYELDGALTMQCTAILEKLMKGKHGPLFSSPVEWNAGYLPDYPQYVKCPMDLGLVHKNLTAGRYARLEDFANDVRLVWRNALLYNFPTSYGFFKDTREKAREFERELAALELEQEKAARARTPQLDSLARCALLLRDLRMNPYAEQLLEPVSGVPEYEAVVRSPMDLGTVGRKLECGAYLSADGFARDVGLVLQNAIVFNSWRYAAAQFWRNSAQFAHRPSITSTARTSASTPR